MITGSFFDQLVIKVWCKAAWLKVGKLVVLAKLLVLHHSIVDISGMSLTKHCQLDMQTLKHQSHHCITLVYVIAWFTVVFGIDSIRNAVNCTQLHLVQLFLHSHALNPKYHSKACSVM